MNFSLCLKKPQGLWAEVALEAPLGATAIPHMFRWHTANANLRLQEQTQPGTFICGSAPPSKRKVKHSKRAPPGITFLSHSLELSFSQGATKGGGSTLLQTILVQGWAGHISKIVIQASRRSSSPRLLKRAPDSRDHLIFRLLCQDHQQRCKMLVFQHVLVHQN